MKTVRSTTLLPLVAIFTVTLAAPPPSTADDRYPGRARDLAGELARWSEELKDDYRDFRRYLDWRDARRYGSRLEQLIEAFDDAANSIRDNLRRKDEKGWRRAQESFSDACSLAASINSRIRYVRSREIQGDWYQCRRYLDSLERYLAPRWVVPRYGVRDEERRYEEPPEEWEDHGSDEPEPEEGSRRRVYIEWER